MFRFIASSLAIVALGAAPGVATAQDSGFLKDYSQLQVSKDPLGAERRAWASPEFNGQNYQKVLVEKFVFYPEAQPNDRVSLGALNDILNYIDTSVRKSLGAQLPVTAEPGAGVARLRLAITAASVDTSLKPYQLIPVALIFTAAKRASGSAQYNVKLAIETEITDSVTGKPLVRVVREAKGLEVRGDQPLTLKVVQPQIDEWTKAAQVGVAERFGKSGK
jgi:hypothetical protein